MRILHDSSRRPARQAASAAAAVMLATGLIMPVAQADNSEAAASDTTSDAAQCQVAATSSQVSWGLRANFRSYVLGFAGGSIDLTEGASASGDLKAADSVIVFPGSKVDAVDGAATITTGGKAHITAHGGILDTTFGVTSAVLNPDGSGSLIGSGSGKSRSQDGSTVTVTDEPLATFTGASSLALSEEEAHTAGTYTKTATATATAPGTGIQKLFGYEPSETMDNPSLSVTYTVSCQTPAPDEPGEEAPAATPAVTLSPAQIDPAVDNQITVTGTGFTGTQTGVYVSAAKSDAWSVGSDPTAVERGTWIGTAYVPADTIADGAFTATVKIPAGTIKDGEKWSIVTFAARQEAATNRSLDTSTALTLKAAEKPDTPSPAPATPAPTTPAPSPSATAQPGHSGTDGGSSAATPEASKEPVCKVSGYGITSGSLEWGFLGRFRTYIQSSIAKGTITETGFTATGGVADPAAKTATINFRGSMHFTGHNGKLDLTIANPVLHVTSATSGYLTATVSATDMEGKAVNPGTVRFADITFSEVSFAGGKVSIASSAVSLTADGATAFAGFYQAGQALDNLTASATLSEQTTCYDADGNIVSTTGGLAKTGTDPLPIVVLSAGALAIGALLLNRRRINA